MVDPVPFRTLPSVKCKNVLFKNVIFFGCFYLSVMAECHDHHFKHLIYGKLDCFTYKEHY